MYTENSKDPEVIIYTDYTDKSHVLVYENLPTGFRKSLQSENWIIYNKHLPTGPGYIFPSTDGGIFYLHAIRIGLDFAKIPHKLVKYVHKPK